MIKEDMDKSIKESPQASDMNYNNISIENAKFIWEEYKYRHEHCWKLIFQITAAVVIILIIPYTNIDIAKSLEYWIVSLPALGIALTMFSILRMHKELEALDKIKSKHRAIQQELYKIDYEKSTSTFSRDVKFYLIGLLLLSIIDIIAIVFIWIPKLELT